MSEPNGDSRQSYRHPGFRSAPVNHYIASGWFMPENRLLVT